MSLIKNQTMTAKNLAAKQRNARKSLGAVTPRGKTKAAVANLQHGIYSGTRDRAMTALGENPQEYRQLLRSLADDLRPRNGLQSELVMRMGAALWRMRRADRMQDGAAWKRVQAELPMEQLAAAPEFLDDHKTYQRVAALATVLTRPCAAPAAEIEELISAFGLYPPEDIKKLFPLLRALAKPEPKSLPAIGAGDAEPAASFVDPEALAAARNRFDDALTEVMAPRRKAFDLCLERRDEVRCAENIAALMAPRDLNAMLVQRMEDSSMRQLWRLTKIFMLLKDQAEEAEPGDAPKNDYIHEKKTGYQQRRDK